MIQSTQFFGITSPPKTVIEKTANMRFALLVSLTSFIVYEKLKYNLLELVWELKYRKGLGD